MNTYVQAFESGRQRVDSGIRVCLWMGSRNRGILSSGNTGLLPGFLCLLGSPRSRWSRRHYAVTSDFLQRKNKKQFPSFSSPSISALVYTFSITMPRFCRQYYTLTPKVNVPFFFIYCCFLLYLTETPIATRQHFLFQLSQGLSITCSIWVRKLQLLIRLIL